MPSTPLSTAMRASLGDRTPCTMQNRGCQAGVCGDHMQTTCQLGASSLSPQPALLLDSPVCSSLGNPMPYIRCSRRSAVLPRPLSQAVPTWSGDEMPCLNCRRTVSSGPLPSHCVVIQRSRPTSLRRLQVELQRWHTLQLWPGRASYRSATLVVKEDGGAGKAL